MKQFSVIVNGQAHTWKMITIYGREVVQLSGFKQATNRIIKFSKGPKRNPEGELTADGLVHIKNDMEFQVSTAIPLWSNNE